MQATKVILICLEKIRTAIKTIMSILDTELNFYAASLSFYTIFALIPLLLIILSIIATLPNFNHLYLEVKNLILSNLVPANSQVVSSYLDTFLQNSSKLGELGFISIAITSILFFKNFQYIAAKVFHSKVRDFWNSVTVYWTLVTLLPIGIGISLFLNSYIQNLLDKSGLDLHINLINFFPMLLTWLLFFVLFKISANKSLYLSVSLFSSFIASLVWTIGKIVFVTYVLYNKAYMTIYGSFSMLLFFLFWIYISWLILLYGMKICEILNEEFQQRCQKGIFAFKKKF